MYSVARAVYVLTAALRHGHVRRGLCHTTVVLYMAPAEVSTVQTAVRRHMLL